MDSIVLSTLLAMFFAFIGAWVQTSMGFGFAIVVAPFLFRLNPDYVPAPLCLVVLFICLAQVVKCKNDLQVGALKAAIIGRIPGSAVGGMMLMFFSIQTLELYLGCLVLLAVAVSLCSIQLKPTSIRMGIAGFFSGVFGTSAAIGGPPMAILLQHEQAHKLRANLSAFFLFSSVLSLLVQFIAGFLSLKHILLTLPLLPAAGLGHHFAYAYCQKVSIDRMRLPVLCLCCISGITAIVHGLH